MRHRKASRTATGCGAADVRHIYERIRTRGEIWRQNHARRITRGDVEIQTAAASLVGYLVSTAQGGFALPKPRELPRKTDGGTEVVSVCGPEGPAWIWRIRADEFKC